MSSIIIDIYCGVYNINQNLEDFLEVHINNINLITEEEFEKVIELLNVQIKEGDLTRQIYQYFIQLQDLNKDEDKEDTLDSFTLNTAFLVQQLQLNI